MPELSRYNVNIVKIFADVLMGGQIINELDIVEFVWDKGNVSIKIKHNLGGGFEYSGVHHPHGECEGNPCKYCGMVWQ